MLLSPAALKNHVAATSRGRYALNSIALTPRGLMSTDGHSLLFTPYPHTDPTEAPKIEGVDPASPAPNADPFLLSLDDAAKAASMLGRPKRFAPVVTQLIQAEIRGDGIVFGVTDLANAQAMTSRRMDGVYPDVGAVIPDYAKSTTFTVNIEQLLRSLKAIAGVTKEPVVTLRIIDDQQAMGLSCNDGTAMLVMPIQVESPAEHVPDQLAKLRPAPGPLAPFNAPPASPSSTQPAEPSRTGSEAQLTTVQEAHSPPQRVSDPALALAARRKRRRRKSPGSAQAELQDIVAGK